METICLVFGSSTAGGAYIPGMSDYVVMVKQGAKVFLGGPPLVKMAIHEESTEEELGGAEMHSRISGVSDYLAADERDAIRLGREIVAQLNWRKLGPSPRASVEEPVYDPEELLGVTSIDVRKPFDVKEVIARIGAAKLWRSPIVTELAPASTFWVAEDYHQEYFSRNPHQPYCMSVVDPKVSKFRKHFRDRLKKQPG